MQVDAQNAIDLPHFLAVVSATLKHLCGTQENGSVFWAAHGNVKVCHEMITEVQSLPPWRSLVAGGQQAYAAVSLPVFPWHMFSLADRNQF